MAHGGGARAKKSRYLSRVPAETSVAAGSNFRGSHSSLMRNGPEPWKDHSKGGDLLLAIFEQRSSSDV